MLLRLQVIMRKQANLYRSNISKRLQICYTNIRVCCGLRNASGVLVMFLRLLLLLLLLPNTVLAIANINITNTNTNTNDTSTNTINTNNNNVQQNNYMQTRKWQNNTDNIVMSQLQQEYQQLQQQLNEQQHSNPHFKMEHATAIVHLHEWKYVDIAEECNKFLGPKGYAGIQLSPVTEHLIVNTSQWQRSRWERYNTISYKLATRSGSEQEFYEMSQTCNAAGVRIYVEVVFNHMAGFVLNVSSNNADNGALFNEPLLGFAGSKAYASNLSYPAVPYSAEDFRKPCSIENYDDAHELRNCQLDGQPVLDHSRANVRTRIVEMLNKLIDMGVAGFYVHAAKYMWPNDLKNIFNAVKNLNSENFNFPANARPFIYQDVFDLGLDGVSKTEYAGNGMVTEYLYAAELSTILSGKAPLSSLINWGPAMGFLPHQDAVVFVDSHDGQPGAARELGSNYLLTHKQRAKYIMANAFMLAHPYGRIKRIMSSFHYAANNVNQGSPQWVVKDAAPAAAAAIDDIFSDDGIRSPEFDEHAQCRTATGWICEHRWPAIVNMLALTNSLSVEQDSVSNFQTDGPNHIAFCRGNKAFIAINNDYELEYATEVHTCLEVGTYCDVISGGLTEDGKDCQGRRVVVNAAGNADILLPVANVNSVASIVQVDNKSVNAANDVNEVDNIGVIAIFVGSKLNASAVMTEESNAINSIASKEQTIPIEDDVIAATAATTTNAVTVLDIDEIDNDDVAAVTEDAAVTDAVTLRD